MTTKLNTTMLDLFRLEANSQLTILESCIANLQKDPSNASEIEVALSAFAALKGAAKIAGVTTIFSQAKQIEDILTLSLQDNFLLEKHFLDAITQSAKLVAEFVTSIDHIPQDWIDSNTGRFEELNQLFSKSDPNAEATSEDNTSTPAVTTTENSNSLADLSMLELFRLEATEQTRILNDSLVALETHSDDARNLEQLMRSSHSLKGAARMVGLDAAVRIAHLTEDIFVAAQQAKINLNSNDMDLLLLCIDSLQQISEATKTDYPSWEKEHSHDIELLVSALNNCLKANTYTLPQLSFTDKASTTTVSVQADGNNSSPQEASSSVRVSGKALNRLLGLAGEAQVASRWLEPFANQLLQIKRRQTELNTLLDHVREQLFDLKGDEHLHELVEQARHKSQTCRELLVERMADLESYDRRASSLSFRLNREILETRMRPFSEGIQGFQRLVRDVSRSLDKDIKLDVRGLTTRVDRDILDMLQAPLNHMIRNAIDHGIESTADRLAAGKPAQGTIRLEAMHSAGMLIITVHDDGSGIDQDALREKIVKKGMVTKDMASKLSETELLDFLFLPNFSTRDTVSEISGRGVGLDVVHNVIQELRGQIRASSTLGEGLKFQLQLPLTLSVIRALLVEIADEIYAFPLGRIDQTLKLPINHIETMEGRQYFAYGDRHIGIITAHQLLQSAPGIEHEEDIPVVILGEKTNQYGIVVDKFLGERNLTVYPIDPRLGKVQDISAASMMEDGSPLLIFDVDDLLRSIDILLSGGRINKLEQNNSPATEQNAKRILVVDDSITVREVERNLLSSKGYQVEIAVDGADGWNAARTKHYDLIISDIDMPRMNGFELVGMLKNDQRLQNTPVIIVSYKDREEDRQRGMEVGADYYLPKGSFHDDTLVDAVMELIGPAEQ